MGDLNFGDSTIKQYSELFKEVKMLNLSCNKNTCVGAQRLAESLEHDDKVSNYISKHIEH